MTEMHYKLGNRLQMLHKSVVYELYEIGWQQVIIRQSFATRTVSPKLNLILIHT